jgi:hypothetical protein
MEQLYIGVPSIKTPYFKDPMRFLFWTFLDILKMSIFGFLKIIFFMRTEKSRNENVWKCRSENGKENQSWIFGFFKKFWKMTPKNGHF